MIDAESAASDAWSSPSAFARRPECMDDDVGGRADPADRLVVVRAHRPLAHVEVPEVQTGVGVTLPTVHERPDAPAGCAVARLQLDDVRAQAGEQAPAVLDRLVDQLHHAHAGQRARVGGHWSAPDAASRSTWSASSPSTSRRT